MSRIYRDFEKSFILDVWQGSEYASVTDQKILEWGLLPWYRTKYSRMDQVKLVEDSL